MSFKKTSEGRVFFQGPDDSANDEIFQPGVPYRPPPLQQGRSSSAGSMQDQQTQMQIVALLKTLNERLKITQNERNAMRRELDAYKNLIGELESKADQSERAYLDLEQKIAGSTQKDKGYIEELAGETLKEMEETRRLLLSLEGKTEKTEEEIRNLKTDVERHQKVGNHLIHKQNTLEQTQKQQAEKVAQQVQRIKKTEERAENLSDTIERTTAEQSRIGRRLDKALEERARFMRKIERIEETVIQTRDSLNAKAMVLLTDQKVVPQADLAESLSSGDSLPPPPVQKLKDGRENEAAARFASVARSMGWTGITAQQAGGLAVFAAICLLGGWLIATVSSRVVSEIESPKNIVEKGTDERTFVNENQEKSTSVEPVRPIEKMDWKISPPAPDSSQEPPKGQTKATFRDDIGTLDLNDPEQVRAALEGKTEEAVATALNAIEPVDSKPENKEEATSEPVRTAVPVTETESPDLTVTDKIENPIKNPRDAIKPDPNLDEVVKKIENQAFEGNAEAQHDLAAIYTAGHGGVKQDYERARLWFEQAAARGVENAAYNLGVLYHQGLGIGPDINKAIAYYKQAAEKGHPEAQYNLGIAYIEGISVSYDPEKAAQYFKKAADRNIMEAAYNLGLIYENGLLGDARPDEALMWYKIAADQGSPEARQALEQLARILNIDPAKVNRLADGMKELKKPETVEAIAERVENTTPNPALSAQILVSQIQEHLMGLGLYPGPADGVNGPLTTDAVRAYQRQNSLTVDGKISQTLLDHMTGAPSRK